MDNPVFNVHDLILILTFVISGVLAVFQPMAVFSNRAAVTLLAIFYGGVAGDAIGILFLWNGFIEYGSGVSVLVATVVVAASLIKGPALYFYVQAITRENFVIHKKLLLDLIPMAIGVSVVWIFGINAQLLKFEVADMGIVLETTLDLLWYFIKCVPVVYGIAAVVSLRRYSRLIKDRYSTIGDVASIWINCLVIGFLGAWVSTLIVNVLGNILTLGVATILGIADNYVTFILIIALFAYSISHIQSLHQTKVELPPVPLDQAAQSVLINKIQTGIFLHKLYLNQSLTIEEFSQEIGAPFREVSSLINKHFNTNFFEFINFHRIEEAKRMLGDPAYNQLSILEILHESGFNSKSAFQRFFKRLTGIAPREYRKLYNSSFIE
jgi:AraC-like DNA-binding protein